MIHWQGKKKQENYWNRFERLDCRLDVLVMKEAFEKNKIYVGIILLTFKQYLRLLEKK